nr:uncharacterized protein LOC116426162 isoform X4 [Nomia melanderi]
MSKYSERIQEILKNTTTKKVTDKRKCVNELLELYENKEAINEICRNTEQEIQGVVNWSYIIHAVHKIVLTETDRHASKDSHSKVVVTDRQNTCTLVRKTVQCANSYKLPLLKCTDVIPLILQILGTNIYEYYHETYMGILVSYILPFRTYQVKILFEQWQELLKICIPLYKNVSSLMNKRTALEALQMIAYYGCLHSDLLPNLKKILPFLETVFLDVKTDQEILAESAYKLTNTVCQQIAIECRYSLCQFSESILPNIISLKSSVEKYKLLLLFIKIHHPKGTCKVDDGAYANNWEEWYAILKSIYLMIMKDLKPDVLPKSFICLASEVFKQILENPVIVERKSLDVSDCVQAAKRRRISNKMDGLIDIITDTNTEEAWPIIQILVVLLKQYPTCLKSQDLAEFLKILVDLLTQSCKEEIIMDSLYELCVTLLKNENIFSITDIENSNMYWDKIWDILLRSLNVNQNEISTHKLTQLFILNNKITNPNALLRLYLTNVIKWSPMSLRTLIILCEYLSLPSDITMFNINTCSPTMNSDSVRLCLLKWALNIPWHKLGTQIMIDELCLLLISIISKSKYEKQIQFKEQDINNSCNCSKSVECLEPSYEYMENCYLLLAYKTNLFVEKEKHDIQEDIKLNERILYMQDIVTSLEIQLCAILEESSGNDDIHIRIMKIAIIAKVISMMKQFNIINNNETPLQHTMKTNLDVIYTSLANIDPSRSKYIYLCNITKALNVLYGTSYDADVSRIIILSSTLDMLKRIFSLMNIEDNEIIDYEPPKDYYEDYSSFQSRRKILDKEILHKKQCNFCNKGTIKIQTSKALALFCCINVGEEKCDIQIKLMNNLLEIDMYDLSCTVDFKMAVIVLESLSKYGRKNLFKNHKEIPLKDILTLYQKCRKDETAVRHILNILPYFLKYAVDYNFNLDGVMNIIFEQNNCQKIYGFRVNIEFTKCLLKIIHISPGLFYYTVPDIPDQIMPMIDSIVSLFTNSLFIVQFELIKCVQEIYLSKYIDFKWKKLLFTKIEESLNKLTINTNIDEKETKIASALLVLATIIVSDGTFQCHALQTMVHFIINQKLEIQIVATALNTITNQINYSSLMEDNLSYLVTCWYNSKYSSQSFPWKLIQCNSEQQFHEIHINTLAFIKFQNFELLSVKSLCNYVNSSFQQIIENIFPQILSWLLYCINEQDNSTKRKLATKIFHKLISNQDEFVEVKKFSSLFNDKFEETLIYLIERLHDETYLEKMLGVQISFAMSDLPHFKHETVNACLKYMEENFFAQEMSIQYVLAHNCPNILQKILLHLVNNIYKKKFVAHKVKAFHQYMFFCILIVQELKQKYFDSLAMYVIKDIGYSLLYIIKAHNDILLEIASKYFYEFVKNILPIRPEEIKEILSFTVTTLIPVVQTKKVPVSLEILNFLLIEQKDIPSDAIQKLNSFPNVPVFQEIRNTHNALKYKADKTYSLEEEIQHFLNSLTDKNINYSVEDVLHLRQQLSTRKKELQELYNKFETLHGFAEDCASSILHQLVYKLIKLTASSDLNVSIEASKCLGDFDAIHGTGSSHLQEHSTRIQHYVHTHKWDKVILAQDVELSFGNMTVIKEMTNGLHQSGFQYLLSNLICTMSKNNEEIDEDIQYECSWRLSNWNFSEINQSLYMKNDYKLKSQITESDYHFYHYQALKYFHEGNEIGIQNAIENARISIIKALRNVSLESSKTIYEKLMQLQLIREIEELSLAKPDEYEKLLKKWKQQDITNFNEFQYIEPVLTQRTIMYQINDTLALNMQLKDALFNTYLDISKIAADKENLHIATRSLAVLAKQTDLPQKIQDQLLYQESLLTRLRNDLKIGRFLLRNLIHKNTLDINLRAQVLRVYGDWMAETKSENPQTVIKNYYLKSIDISTSIDEQTVDSIKNLHNTQVALARFADAQFEQICTYMKSTQFESLKECVTYSTEGVNMHSISKDKDVRRALILNQKQHINDVAELEHIQRERDNYLSLALQYYLLVLQQSEDYNLLIFRVVALWLDNIKQKEVNDLLNANLNKISSFKFIPLIPQLAAHINDVFDTFSEKIYTIMKHCALEHPHHTLPVLLALKNLYGDYEYNTTQMNKTLEPRVLGARKLLHELTKSNISTIVHEMDKLSHSLVMLANLTTSSSKPGSIINIPKNQEILKIKNFINVLVPTLTINVKASRNYNNVIGISKYVETYETVGGLNTPKKIICIGTDGISRYQLVKGKDDLRQDAVMQQVFNIMNILLKAHKETKRRKLMIRTYKVVPLTQRSGILEWCNNTIPIITILIGSNNDSGLHKKYYPKDYTAKLCKEKLAGVEKSSTDVKLKVFMDCCANMHPVLHHFFTEKYPSPETWFERRLAYTRSVATTSIAGYILGLGDRHFNNILLDQATAEVIHIDFGIAFEQGKVLPIPETIPFRLTQNIEVAMGVSGIEGTMRQCCEKTLTILRDQRQIIITLLQVLLYDPLFTWTITPAKAHNIQSGNSLKQVEINQGSIGTNKTAERALLRIEQKLQGTEEGLPSSIFGQVERLIQQARDPVNLSRLYYGWQPYL